MLERGWIACARPSSLQLRGSSCFALLLLPKYGAGEQCTWLIKPANGRPTIRFLAISLADGDSIKVYDGNDASDTLLTTVTGADAALSQTATTSKGLFVVFSTAADTPGGAGFDLSYSTGLSSGGASTLLGFSVQT